MNSKERAALRAQANSLNALFQIGKGGITDNLINETLDALRARELIKLKVLTETAPVTVREAAEQLAAATDSAVVQVIGGVMVLYKYNPELHKKASEKKSVIKKKTEASIRGAGKHFRGSKAPLENKKERNKRVGRRGGAEKI